MKKNNLLNWINVTVNLFIDDAPDNYLNVLSKKYFILKPLLCITKYLIYLIFALLLFGVPYLITILITDLFPSLKILSIIYGIFINFFNFGLIAMSFWISKEFFKGKFKINEKASIGEKIFWLIVCIILSGICSLYIGGIFMNTSNSNSKEKLMILFSTITISSIIGMLYSYESRGKK